MKEGSDPILWDYPLKALMSAVFTPYKMFVVAIIDMAALLSDK